MKKHGFDITPDINPLGIRYWAYIYQHGTPRFEVYVCLGKDEKTGHFVFETRSGRTFVIARRYEELLKPEFKPFLFNFQVIDQEMDRVEDEEMKQKENK